MPSFLIYESIFSLLQLHNHLSNNSIYIQLDELNKSSDVYNIYGLSHTFALSPSFMD